MSTHTLEDADRAGPTAGPTRRTDVPAIRLPAADRSDDSLAHLEGRILVLYGDADAPAIEAFDRTRRTGDDALLEWLASADAADEPAGEKPALTYHGRVVARGLSLDDGDSAGIVHLPFLGGDIDEGGFAVETDRLAADVEYRLAIVPPTLDDGERDVGSVLPEDIEESALHTDFGVTHLMVPTSDTVCPPTYYLSGPAIDEVELGTSDGVDDLDANPSFEELFDASR